MLSIFMLFISMFSPGEPRIEIRRPQHGIQVLLVYPSGYSPASTDCPYRPQPFITSSPCAPSQTHHPPCLKMEANMIGQTRTVSLSSVVDALQRPFVRQSISPLTPRSEE